jgi:adenylate cyclase
MSQSSTQRRLAAILATDVVGYSRLMGQDETGTLTALALVREITERQISQHRGRIANTAGDSVIAEFVSAVDATSCALILQEVLVQQSPENRKLQIRIGIHVGDVVGRGEDILGSAVNIAARLENMAQPGGIVVSAAVRDDVSGKLPAAFTSLGTHQLKNIEQPMLAYSVASQAGGSPASLKEADRNLKLPQSGGIPIAILPFTNMSSDPEQEFLADGFTEDLITEISRLKDFLVIARNTVFTYKGRAIDIGQVGRELGVRYVLEGSMRKLGPRIRITAQLIEASTGTHLWAEKFDRDFVELFETQDEVVRAVAASTQTRLMLNEGERAARVRSDDLDFWGLVTRGRREIYRNTPESLKAAEEIGRKLVGRDPTSSKARQVLAWALHKLVILGYRAGTPELIAEIAKEAREAARLDPNDEYSLSIYGMVLDDILGRPEEAVVQLELALKINPSFSFAYGTMGPAYTKMGRLDEAIKQIQIAIRLDPRNPTLFHRYTSLAEANFKKRDHQQALHWAHQAIALKDDYWYPNALATATLALNGDIDRAKTAAINLRSCLPTATISYIRATAHFSDEFWVLLSEGLALAGIPN